MMVAVRTGLDVWATQGFKTLEGQRVGAIVNPTSVDRRFCHLIDLLHNSKGVTLKALFSPEHGLRGEAQYMVPISDVAQDRRTRIPVYSLYGQSRQSLTPRPECLQDLDCLIFDIQDIGCRYYTYIYTMALAMQAAAQAKVAFVVLDRPNPLGLVKTEGNLVRQGFHSFVGLYPLPNRHGMTVGEIARLLNETQGFEAQLDVVRCEGLTRDMSWHDTGCTFIPPSPNMPTVHTARVYPGMCLSEGTNLSEGRGTCHPFEQFGAPYLESHAVAEALNLLELPGVLFRPCSFTPCCDKWAGQSCEGAFIHVLDENAFRPVLTGLATIKACLELGGDAFAWRTHAYEFVEDVPAFDLLCGTDTMRTRLASGSALDSLTEGFEKDMRAFEKQRQRFLLYE